MKVGVLALQGAFREHREVLDALGVEAVEVRTPAELGALDGVRILSEASVAAMGQNQIGDIVVELQEAANPNLTKPFPLGAGSAAPGTRAAADTSLSAGTASAAKPRASGPGATPSWSS